jgi:fatty acid desaturase
LLRRFDVLFHEHDMVNRTTFGQEWPKSAATRPLMLCIYVGAWAMCFLWFIVAFAVLVVVIWVVSGVDMSGTTQQLVL